MALILVTGGARSGKSTWAEELASSYGPHVLYVATASLTTGAAAVENGIDEEMVQRIRRHQQRRSPSWTTLEEPYDLGGAIGRWLEGHPGTSAVLVDCLTLWISNWLVKLNPATEGEASPLVELSQRTASALAQMPVPVIAVSNEVGLGIVPDHPLSRVFRDVAGRMNQVFARESEAVYAVWSGIPVEIKSLDARFKR